MASKVFQSASPAETRGICGFGRGRRALGRESPVSVQPVLVSVLVPMYNAARYLPELCESIRAQTYPHYEVLLGNDGSTDDTAAVAARYLADKRFELLGWEQNRGLNQAWAALLSRAKGQYWCSPGADDVLVPSFLERRVKMLQAHPGAGLLHGAVELIDESGRACPAAEPLLRMPAQLKAPRSIEVLLQHNVVKQPSALLRMSTTSRVLPLFGRSWVYAPDWFLWLLHAATGAELLWDEQVAVKYRMHAESLTSLPGKAAARHAEVALAPLCGLATGSGLSEAAAALWARWRKALYHRWLLRALTLRARGELKEEWLQQGAAAFYGVQTPRVSLWSEAIRHGPGALLTRRRERGATRAQRFPVAGLAQVNDPAFR